MLGGSLPCRLFHPPNSPVSRKTRFWPLLLQQQRDEFAFTTRSHRPPRDSDFINCLISFLYALVRHDCIAALTSIGLDPLVGFLHVDRPNRPLLAIDLREEFHPWLADRIAIIGQSSGAGELEQFRLDLGGAGRVRTRERNGCQPGASMKRSAARRLNQV